MRHTELRMLKNSRRVGHPDQVVQFDIRKVTNLLIEGFRRKNLSRDSGTIESGLLETLHIKVAGIAPDHFPAHDISVFAHGGAARLIIQKIDNRPAKSFRITKRHQYPAIVGK